MLIEKVLPHYDVTVVKTVVVRADADTARAGGNRGAVAR
jgi:hypothetical protein